MEEILEALTIIEEEENRTEKDIEIIRKAKQEINKLTKKIEKEKAKNKKALKIIDEAMTEQMITGEATINLIELYAILKGKR